MNTRSQRASLAREADRTLAADVAATIAARKAEAARAVPRVRTITPAPRQPSRHTFHAGEYVAALHYERGRGTVLDYGARIVEMDGPDAAIIRYSDGDLRRASTHPDYVESMEPAYALARRMHADGIVPATLDPSAVLEAAGEAHYPCGPMLAQRTAWVLAVRPHVIEATVR